MYKPVETIEVNIWDRIVGALALDPKLGFYAFEYAASFLKSGIELAPIQLPLTNGTGPFVFTDLPESTYKRLPAFIADALPDDFGNALIDAWMASKGVAKNEITALDRLAYMGKRGMGALEFKPVRSPSVQSTTAIQLSKLVESARSALYGHFDSDALTKTSLAQIIQLGTSAGGARAKAVIAWNKKTKEIRAGQFEMDKGFEPWILKFDGMGPDRELGGTLDYGRVEYAYSLMAKVAGITMAPCQLLEENGRAHFMTSRFDRSGNNKHHLQSLCAMSHLDYKQRATHDYSQLFLIIQKLGLNYDALTEAFRRMTFNIMAANCDDHPKNFSFLLKEDMEENDWQLAPAYDLTHAYNPKGKWTHQHLMGVNGKFLNHRKKDLLLLAEQFGIGTAPKIMVQVGEAVKAWPEFAKKAGLGEKAMMRVKDHHRGL